jgi:ferrochelatase
LKTSGNSAVLLVNLGTPDAPTPKAVKRYLAEFLHDRRVIKLSRWLWCPLLHFIILPTRSKRVAKLYQAIWWDEGSPMRVITERKTEKLRAVLPEYEVFFAMRYGKPSMQSVLEAIAAKDFAELIVLPLYPQYSDTTTASVADQLKKIQKTLKLPPLKFIHDYHNHPDYIAALANSIQKHWDENGKAEKLIFSFHGIPKKYVHDGDIYPEHCHATVAGVVEKLGLAEHEYQTTFQSRFGPTEWVKPYTDATLIDWAKQGIKHVDVLSPAFAADCLETLEELKVTNRDLFFQHGGEKFDYIAALNESDEHIQMLAGLIKEI